MNANRVCFLSHVWVFMHAFLGCARCRITVRQLESLIRLSEARARLDLSPTVTHQHVIQAANLLKQSFVGVDAKVTFFVCLFVCLFVCFVFCHAHTASMPNSTPFRVSLLPSITFD
jgi:hypothetical protein